MILRPKEYLVLYTDASNEGWGGHVGGRATGGRWSDSEKEEHINVLELKAIELSLQSLCEGWDKHIKVFTDNMTAVAYVKHQGGVKSPACNEVAQAILAWCEEREIFLSVAHIPGIDNDLADFKFRHFSDNVEWSLNDKLFKKVVKVFGEPEIDLFATRLNNKVDKYVSWKPDPTAFAIDAFSLEWSNMYFYAFPPFSCISRVIQKILDEGAEERQPGSSGDTRQSRLVAQDPIGGLPILGKSLCRKGFDKDTVLLLMEAWRPSTKKSYSTYLRKWSTYCVEKSVNVLHPTLPQVCRFLRVLDMGRWIQHVVHSPLSSHPTKVTALGTILISAGS